MVSGRARNSSVSLHAIQVKRGDSLVFCANPLNVTNTYRATPSVDAQPTQEPVLPWSPTVHHALRRSTLDGSARCAPSTPASSASANRQSVLVLGSGVGTRLQMRSCCGRFRVVVFPMINPLWLERVR